MRILTVNTQPEQWAEMHALPHEVDDCPKCGVKRLANIPFASNGYRGFMSELHECGERYRLRIFRAIGEELRKWERLGQQD